MSNDSRTKNAARNLFFGTITRIYNLIIPFLMRTAMIYWLGMEYVGLNTDEFMWYPDISFPGDAKGTTSGTTRDKDALIWVYPSGDIFYSVRYFLEFQSTTSSYRRKENRICTIPIESFRCSTKSKLIKVP